MKLEEKFLLIILNFIAIFAGLVAVNIGGMSIGYIYIYSILINLICLYKIYKLTETYLWFLLSYILLFYVARVFDLFIEDLFLVDNYYLNIYDKLNISCIHIFNIFYLVLFKSGNNNYKIEVNYKRFKFTNYIFLAGCLFSAILMFFSVGGLSAISSSRVDLKYVSGTKIIALWLTYFFSIHFFLISLYIKKISNNFLVWLIFLFYVLAIDFVYMIALRNRTMFLLHFLMIIFALVFSSKFMITHRNVVEKSVINIRKIKIFKLMFLFSILGVIAVYIRFARGVYFETSNTIEIGIKDMLMLSIQNGDIGYTATVLDVLYYMDSNNLYLNGQSYLRLLGIIIPDFLWTNKPPTTDSLIGQALTGLDVQTIPPGIFGDAFLNFRYWGVLLFIIYGAMFALIDRSRNVYFKVAFFSLSFVMIFHFVRGSFVNVVFSLLLMTFGIIFSKYLMKLKVNEY